MSSRLVISFVLLIGSISLTAQEKDTRGLFEIEGDVHRISVSPNEVIWLTTSYGTTYYTPSIGQDWHAGPVFQDEDLKAKQDSNSLPYPRSYAHDLLEIVWFSPNQALMGGREPGAYFNRKSGHWFSKDQGTIWKFRKKRFGESYGPVDVNVLPGGYGWWLPSGRELYYTSNAGRSWKTRSMLPYMISSRSSIWMKNVQEGWILLGRNQLIHTRDNWETSRAVPTPVDVFGDRTKTNRRGRYVPEKVREWKGHLFVRQNQRWYRSPSDSIAWFPLPGGILDLEVDRENDQLLAIDSSLQTVRYVTPEQVEAWQTNPLQRPPKDLSIVNGALFVVDTRNDVYRITDSSFVRTQLYTRERKVEDLKRWNPDTIHGIEWQGRHLYSRDENGEWFREHVFNEKVFDIAHLPNEQLVLWQPDGGNVLYDRRTQSVRPYQWSDPLAGFLRSPIDTVILTFLPRGAMDYKALSFRYTRGSGSQLELREFNRGNRVFSAKEHQVPVQFPVVVWQKLLAATSAQPREDFPMYGQFEIDSLELDSFAREMDERSRQAWRKPERETEFKKMGDFAHHPEVNLSLMRSAFEREGQWWTGWFDVRLMNRDGERLIISGHRNDWHGIGHPRVHFRYNHRHVESYDLRWRDLVFDQLPGEQDSWRKNYNLSLLYRLASKYVEQEDEH